jgi:fatty-acyl-CoA synthase
MAALVADRDLNLADLRQYLATTLPSYARPVFLRLRSEADLTGTFKYSKTELIRQGYDPTASSDALYFDNDQSGAFVELNAALYRRIQNGEFRL